MLQHWPQGVANWPPKSDGILFFSTNIGTNTRPQSSAFSSSNLGQIEKLFFVSALTPSVKALGS
jgi:hypothetical protein